MQAAHETTLVSVEDYLAGERTSEVRHEYLGGMIYAMAGASEDHNVIELNVATALRQHLRGKACRTFVNDLKLRLNLANQDLFYYPDVMVVCDPRDTDPYAKRFPKILVEVLSPETERTDRREKFWSYIQTETLEEYVLVAQDKMEVTVFRRAKQWAGEILRQPDQLLQLPSIGFSLSLSAVYEGVNLGRLQ
jgi:Uma2 family endonuclease